MRLSSKNDFILGLILLFLRKGSLLEDRSRWDHLDWNEILAIGRHQNLFPLIYHVLSSHEEILKKVPVWVQEEFREGCLDHTALILLYENVLPKILIFLDREKIPFILLKGPSTAFEFYRPREIRPYTDLDVLIRDRDYGKVKEGLLKFGFEISNSEGETIRRKYFNSVSFSRQELHEIHLDLHWETCMSSWNQQPFLNVDSVWKNIRWIGNSEMKLPVLPPQMLLLYLCLHLTFHHQFGKILTLCDLDLVIQKFGGDLDWEEIARSAREMQIKKSVYYSLKMAALLLKSEVPESILNLLRPNRIALNGFPLDFLVFRKKDPNALLERFVKFILIDSMKQKASALINFYQVRGKY